MTWRGRWPPGRLGRRSPGWRRCWPSSPTSCGHAGRRTGPGTRAGPTMTAGLLAAAAFVEAGRARRAAWTWAGSALVLLGVAHVVLVRLDPTPPRPLVLTLLAHATLTLAAGLAAGRRSELWRAVF